MTTASFGAFLVFGVTGGSTILFCMLMGLGHGLFAVARTIGWVSQWKEMVEDPSQRIGRPRQIYSGAAARDYVPVEKR